MIDAKRLPEKLILETRIPYRKECDCGREVCGEVKAKIDIAPHIRQAVEDSIVGAFQLPAGSYEVVVNIGHSGAVLSAQMVRN